MEGDHGNGRDLEALSEAHGVHPGPVSTALPVIYERLLTKSDPDHERYNIVQCIDVSTSKDRT